MGMRDRFRRSSEPPVIDFAVIGLDPGEWPGGVGVGLLPNAEGGIRGALLRYDLLGGSAPVYAVVSRRAAEGADEPAAGETAAAVLLAAAQVADVPGVLSEESDLATLAGEPVFITRTAYEDPQLTQVDLTWPDGTDVGVAGWGKPVGLELLSLLRPLPPELFGAVAAPDEPGTGSGSDSAPGSEPDTE